MNRKKFAHNVPSDLAETIDNLGSVGISGTSSPGEAYEVFVQSAKYGGDDWPMPDPGLLDDLTRHWDDLVEEGYTK